MVVTSEMVLLTVLCIAVAVFATFSNRFRACLVGSVLTAVAAVALPLLGLVLVIPAVVFGIVVSMLCLIANDEQRQVFEQKFKDTIRGANDEEEQQ